MVRAVINFVDSGSGVGFQDQIAEFFEIYLKIVFAHKPARHYRLIGDDEYFKPGAFEFRYKIANMSVQFDRFEIAGNAFIDVYNSVFI